MSFFRVGGGYLRNCLVREFSKKIRHPLEGETVGFGDGFGGGGGGSLG